MVNSSNSSASSWVVKHREADLLYHSLVSKERPEHSLDVQLLDAILHSSSKDLQHLVALLCQSMGPSMDLRKHIVAVLAAKRISLRTKESVELWLSPFLSTNKVVHGMGWQGTKITLHRVVWKNPVDRIVATLHSWFQEIIAFQHVLGWYWEVLERCLLSKASSYLDMWHISRYLRRLPQVGRAPKIHLLMLLNVWEPSQAAQWQGKEADRDSLGQLLMASPNTNGSFDTKCNKS